MERHKCKYDAIDPQIAKSNRAKRICILRMRRGDYRAEEQDATNGKPRDNNQQKQDNLQNQKSKNSRRAHKVTNSFKPQTLKGKQKATKIRQNKLLECHYCGALVWEAESSEKSKEGHQLFTICCQKGRVYLPRKHEPPEVLAKLLESPKFKECIRIFNSLLAFTSIGAKIDESVMYGYGPHTFRIHGQNHHQIGGMIPVEGKPPQFGQLYIYDTAHEIKNRINTMSTTNKSKDLDEKIVEALVHMLDENNMLAKEFRKARNRYESGQNEEFTIRLVAQEGKGKQYDLPSTDEIAGLLVGDSQTTSGEQDVIVQYKTSQLQRISTLHQHFMALQYPLLFPYGESGFHLQIPYRQTNENKIKRQNVTMREYYAYQLQTRLTEGKTLVKGGRLLHQFMVDAYTEIESNRLRFNKDNKKKLRAELYNNVRDTVGKGDTDSNSLGKRVILPSSFTGGPRYMLENYHDAMAICRSYGNPHLFITITANPNWEEIVNHLGTYNKDPGNERPDIASRVFKMKLDEMLLDFKHGVFFGPLLAVVHTIEIQKRGLPHAHILVWLEGAMQNPLTSVIDNFISAEIPDKDGDPEGYELVKKHMMHGPCGISRLQSPCMQNGVCTKKYPWEFTDATTCDKSGYIIHKRRDEKTKFVMKGETRLDNRYVIPYNMDILKRYKAHINVEWCSTSKTIKYLFKYITKGVEKATFAIERQKYLNHKDTEKGGQKKEVDEIDNYQECRYLSACEASWRIFGFDIHQQRPSVLKLPVHLPGQQSVVFDESDTPEDVAQRIASQKTMFIQWMETNKKDSFARTLTYIQFPIMYVWDSSARVWKRRTKCKTIGRIVNILPSQGELYYLRTLLNHVKGPRSYEEIRTVGGVLQPTFKGACYAMGLLHGDKEWHDAMEEASQWAPAPQLRELFVLLLLYCEVSHPGKLWSKSWKNMREDILYNQRKKLNFEKLHLNDEEVEQYTLIEIQKLLIQNDKSLGDFSDMPMPDKNIINEMKKSLVREEKATWRNEGVSQL